MKIVKIFVILSLLLVPINLSFGATGDLSVYISSLSQLAGAAPGDTVVITAGYYWQGDNAPTNVVLTYNFPSELELISTSVEPTSKNGNEFNWQINNMSTFGMGTILITASVKNNVPFGTVITNIISITSSDSDTEPDNNTATLEIKIQKPLPDLWAFQFGLLETMENGIFFTAEVDVPVDIELYYANMSYNKATGVVVTDTLPDGVEFISSDPQPTSVNGNILVWNLGDFERYYYGQINMKVKPTTTGEKKIVGSIYCSEEDADSTGNNPAFSFNVVSVLQPIVLKPLVTYFGDNNSLIMPSNPKFTGLAKAGAKVTLYEGDSTGCFGDLSQCNPVEIDGTIAGQDRKWEITPTTLTEDRKYFLYIQAESNGDKSQPFLSMWSPITLQISSIFDSAGFDMDHFVVESGGHNVYPGAYGGKSGTTPNEDIIIKKRFKAPPSILTDTSMWKYHEMKLVITDNGQTYEQMQPLSAVEAVHVGKTEAGNNAMNKTEGYWTYDFIYVIKGFGPGAHVEVWCRPLYYPDGEEIPIVGLVFVKCHEILIDPAGYVYDTEVAGMDYEWPAIPPKNSLIKNATVTAITRTGDDAWERWNAEATGQVNPQVTDSTTSDGIFVPGYYAFYVPSGQYQVKASAPDYADYISPILTVVDEPIFHNVGMKKISESVTGIKFPNEKKTNTGSPEAFELEQNYPNPFNPMTTIAYKLPVASRVTLKIYNTIGEEVATLLKDEFKTAGRHLLQFNASALPSGIYFYRIIAGKFNMTKKSVLIK